MVSFSKSTISGISQVVRVSGSRYFMRFNSSFVPAGPLTTEDLNSSTLEAKYAVRGKIPIRAEELRAQLESGEDHGLPYDTIINANIGNPQQLDQKPLTWYRQVLSILQYPHILDKSNTRTIHNLFPQDVIDRAKALLNNIGSIGAYSHSQGSSLVRQSIADFITKRDGYPANPNDIFLTSGASAAVQYLLQVLSRDEHSGFLIPIPQYPLYTATIALNRAVPVGYYLDEANSWSTDPKQIRQLIKENKEKGISIRALVVINPGNPTGAILKEKDIEDIIDIAAEHGMVIIADEVYQENVFHGEFISVRKVLCRLLAEKPHLYGNVQLASLHSTSKGVSGECGQRGGYMELVGFTKEVRDVIFKLTSINLCSVVSGQSLVELMINPPKEGDHSYPLYHKETSRIHNDLRERADSLYEAFTKMEDITCNRPEGAMYLFPRLSFDKEKYPKLFELSEKSGSVIDEIYCEELLEATGICCVPGSGFGQAPGTYHLRTTFLPPGTEWINRWENFHKEFIKKYSL